MHLKKACVIVFRCGARLQIHRTHELEAGNALSASVERRVMQETELPLRGATSSKKKQLSIFRQLIDISLASAAHSVFQIVALLLVPIHVNTLVRT